MHAWREHMPAGMFLKSEGCASNLSDPDGRFTLSRFCAEHGLAYGDYASPVPLETFARYGMAFQRRLVPEVEAAQVVELDKPGRAFELRLSGGETVSARRVVIAVGMAYFGYVPATLRALPPELASHSSRHHDLSRFRGRDVTVIGGGQSALETAALLREQGASARILVRRPSVVWNTVPTPDRRPLRQRVRRPVSGLGLGWRTLFYAQAPGAFHYLAEQARLRAVRTALGPAGAWWLRQRVDERLPVLLEHTVLGAETSGDRVRLRLGRPDRVGGELMTDHVIAATGYRVDLEALPFLRPALLARLRRLQRGPALSRDFESSVPGLYFVGLASANEFGPVMRFVFGADYTARRIATHLTEPSPGRRRVRAWGTPRPGCQV
jgi:cation diffusion facilitator CzcD-associated flavoprotein CzcO